MARKKILLLCSEPQEAKILFDGLAPTYDVVLVPSVDGVAPILPKVDVVLLGYCAIAKEEISKVTIFRYSLGNKVVIPIDVKLETPEEIIVKVNKELADVQADKNYQATDDRIHRAAASLARARVDLETHFKSLAAVS